MTTAKIYTLDPTSGPLVRRDPRKLAARPETLDGAVVGLVANGIGATQQMLDALYEELSKTAELRGSIKVLKRQVAIPPEPEDWERLVSEVTVAVTGFGG